MTAPTFESALRAANDAYLARDFVETRDGLLFAVVANATEAGRVLCSLRYRKCGGKLQKQDTEQANQLLREKWPKYLYRSHPRDVDLHGVHLADIARHYRPTARLEEILAQNDCHPLLNRVRQLVAILGPTSHANDPIGITGSILVGAQHVHSDIDFVAYGRENFATTRARLRMALTTGEAQGLTEPMWRDAFLRRGCSLAFDEFLWHERRKFNKCSFRGTKVDITGVAQEPALAKCAGKKLEQTVITAQVLDASAAFDYPASYAIRHSEFQQVVSFTPTYMGQALEGEIVEAAGWKERCPDGRLRLIIGTSREASGEYLKVVRGA